MNKVNDYLKEYDVSEDVLLFNRFNLFLDHYKHGKEMVEADIALIHKMLDKCGHSPILRWLALNFISKNATIAAEIIEEQKSLKKQSSFKLNLHDRFSFGD